MKVVQVSKGMNWRRWVAMLCIALLSSVVLEEASPAHAAADIAEAMASLDPSDTQDAAVDATSSDSEQSPAGQTKPEHHCCPAHCGNTIPTLSGATISAQATISVSSPLTVEHVLTRAPSGLERPPKLTAII